MAFSATAAAAAAFAQVVAAASRRLVTPRLTALPAAAAGHVWQHSRHRYDSLNETIYAYRLILQRNQHYHWQDVRGRICNTGSMA
jgi:hypothetical protein